MDQEEVRNDVGTNAELEEIPPAANVVANKTPKLLAVILMLLTKIRSYDSVGLFYGWRK
jgi:hypothetical protein